MNKLSVAVITVFGVLGALIYKNIRQSLTDHQVSKDQKEDLDLVKKQADTQAKLDQVSNELNDLYKQKDELEKQDNKK